MAYTETETGTIWENPPPAPTHKTSGITRTEWIGLFTGPEITLATKTRALLNDTSETFGYLNGGALMDANAASIGRPDATYRDLMRDVFFHFDSAAFLPGISVDSQTVVNAMTIQVAIGLLSQERSDEIILGVPF